MSSLQATPAPEIRRHIDFFRRATKWLKKNLPAFDLDATWVGDSGKPGANVFCTCRNPGIYVDICRYGEAGFYVDVFVGVWPLQQDTVQYRRFVSSIKDLVEAVDEYEAWRNSPALVPFRHLKNISLPIKNDPTLMLVEHMLRDLRWAVMTRLRNDAVQAVTELAAAVK